MKTKEQKIIIVWDDRFDKYRPYIAVVNGKIKALGITRREAYNETKKILEIK